MQSNTEVIKSLTEQNDELENYFRNTIIPQLFVDASLILRKFTPPAMKQFSLSNVDIDRPMAEIHDNFRYPSIIENIQTVIDSNEILEKEIQTTDLRWYQMNIIPYIQKENNQTNGVIITFVEITFRIRDLKEQEKLISDHETLLDTLSHDIKNPLGNLILAIDEFKTSGLENQESFDTLLGIVERALGKIQDLIEDLSESRAKEHKYKSHAELLNFEHILEDVRLTLNEDIRTSGAIIKTDIQISEITFSRRKLRSIIYNLLNNAIKYRSPEKSPAITISIIPDDEYIVISITDNGIGIDESKHEAVFSKYYRLDNSLEGSGIGLYLVKELVVNSGGKILLESEPGKGTTIRVFLKDLVKTPLLSS
ncbi:ATP-binding protein [Ferruginibacter paludis]|uniref:sensor histidine kinase n=1 Tax=Ferruginibacter paludis TaxID=1310417 RepID=UPI0025B3CFA7|nr:ATP-binding protein [Ferruginibacter paludis]MDN3654252.1 ATP-binding protein [Ferruginibacter paludis]